MANKKNKKSLFLGLNKDELLILGVVGVITYFLYSKRSSLPSGSNNQGSNGGATGGSSGGTITTGCPEDTFGYIGPPMVLDQEKLLKKESPLSYQIETAALQRALNRKGACLEVDGYFGDLTEAELRVATGKTSVTLNEILSLGYSWA